MSENSQDSAYSLDDIVSEQNLAQALGVSLRALRDARYKHRLSHFRIGFGVFYHAPTLVHELLSANKMVRPAMNTHPEGTEPC